MDIEEDGFEPQQSNAVKWNTFKTVPDASKWEVTEPSTGDKILDIPRLRSALAVAYADKVSGSVKGHCKIQYGGQIPQGVVQIPFHTNGRLGIVTLRPVNKFVIPNDDRHIVQRRINRCVGSSISDDVADNLLTSNMSINVGSATITSSMYDNTCKIHFIREGEETKELLFP